MVRIEESSPVPLYHQLKEAIRSQIQSGEFEPGAQIPPEWELMERYGVSRSTVRFAIMDLVREGLLYRKRGRGTFVAEPKVTRWLPGLSSFTEDMLARKLKPGSRLLNVDIVPSSQEVSLSLRVRKGEKVARLERQVFADDEPIGLHIIHLRLDVWNALGIGRKEELDNRSLYALLESKAEVVLDEADETIETGVADDYMATLLGIKKGSPILIMKRTVFSDKGEPIEYATNIYRGDRYKYHIRHKRRRPEAKKTESVG